MTNDTSCISSETQDTGGGRTTEAGASTPQGADDGQLSAIPEGTEEGSIESAASYLQHGKPELQQLLKDIKFFPDEGTVCEKDEPSQEPNWDWAAEHQPHSFPTCHGC